jgi:hypothetical protein
VAIDTQLFGHQPVEELARASDERFTLQVFVTPGCFAHEE